MSTGVSVEQRVRDMLERLGVPGAQSYSAGELVELANALNHGSLVAMHETPIEGCDPPHDYMTPEWGAGGKVHNWCNYVSDRMRALWPTFTVAQRAAIAESADDSASREIWD